MLQKHYVYIQMVQIKGFIMSYTPHAFVLHHRPQNLGKKSRNAKKKQKCKKKAEMQKKQKMHFNLKIHARIGQKWNKRKHLYLDFFAFVSLVHFFAF